ncbi:MAG: hypothetical protein Fur0027_00610 [Raineya sp.]
MEFDFYKIFTFQANQPLDFLQPFFWGFFFILLILYGILHKNIVARNVLLLCASFYFYYKSGGFYFWLLIFSTLTDYLLALWIHQYSQIYLKRFFLLLSLLCNLGILVYYKYAYLFTDFFNTLLGTHFVAHDYLAQFSNMLTGSDFDVTQIVLPVGISFYVFQTLSYTIDVYRGKLPATKNFLEFALFVSFFPQLVAGPIVRASDFLPQIGQSYQISEEEMGKALWLILKGMSKKLIADYLGINLIGRIFENPFAYSGFENLMGVYGFAIQIYFDFSGYTDIAIGLALLLGFRLPLNFKQPYKASNITDFWRRWHISLSSWLRDYLYISLGGSRKTSLFTYATLPLCIAIVLLNSPFALASWIFFVLFLFFWVMWLIKFQDAWGYVGLHILTFWAGLLYTQKAYIAFFVIVFLFVMWLSAIWSPKRRQMLSTDANLMITMLLGGLWHGASWRFMIWGALHGLALGLHKTWLQLTAGNIFFSKNKLWSFFSKILTFHFICVCWIFFRANSINIIAEEQIADIQVAQIILQKIFYHFQWHLVPEVITAYRWLLGGLFLAYAAHFLPEKWKLYCQQLFIKLPDFMKALLIVMWIIGVFYQMRSADIQPFIYFQF